MRICVGLSLLPLVWAVACGKDTPSEPTTPDEQEPPEWLIHVEGVVMDGASAALGVTVEAWALGTVWIPDFWGVKRPWAQWVRARSSVTDANGKYHFDISQTDVNSGACAGVAVGSTLDGWLVATTKNWTSDCNVVYGPCRPPAAKPLIPEGHCFAGLLTGPILERIPCEGGGVENSVGDKVCPELAVELLSPPDGAVFSHVPRTTTLVWRSIPGASSYSIKWYHGHPGCTDLPCAWYGEGETSTLGDTTFTFDFAEAGLGRWSVSASKNNARGPTSYSYFKYVQ